MTGEVMPAYEKRGHLASIYLEFKDGRDPRKGIENFGSGPRFSTGYAALQNRPALLIETHMLKPYAVRVHATYDLVELMLHYVDTHPAELLKVDQGGRPARDRSRQAGRGQRADHLQAVARVHALHLQGLRLPPQPQRRVRAANGSSTTRARRRPTPSRTGTTCCRTGRSAPPAAYAVPAQWTDGDRPPRCARHRLSPHRPADHAGGERLPAGRSELDGQVVRRPPDAQALGPAQPSSATSRCRPAR